MRKGRGRAIIEEAIFALNVSEPGSQGFVSHIQLEPLLLPSPR
jgi:hypothetical protein